MFDLLTARSIARRELTAIVDIAAGLPAQDWLRLTECDGWTVRDLCSHAGLAAVQQAESFRRVAKGVLEPPEFPGAPAMEPAEVVELLGDGARALDAALGDLPDEAMAGMTPMPFGVVPTVVAIQIPVHEYAFHGHDLRTAVDDDAPFPDDVAAALIAFFPGLAPMLAARAEPGVPTHALRLEAPSGAFTLAPGRDGWAVVEATEHPVATIRGPDDAVALFAMGRIGADDPRLDVDAAAADFKRWFPGP